MKKIWIVGSLGHMGQALIRLLDMMEYELYETDKDELDITDEHAVSLFMHRNRPDVVINCAGYHPSAGAAQSETCLLYTSDAADPVCCYFEAPLCSLRAVPRVLSYPHSLSRCFYPW